MNATPELLILQQLQVMCQGLNNWAGYPVPKTGQHCGKFAISLPTITLRVQTSGLNVCKLQPWLPGNCWR